jgi:hypothetical protein
MCWTYRRGEGGGYWQKTNQMIHVQLSDHTSDPCLSLSLCLLPLYLSVYLPYCLFACMYLHMPVHLLTACLTVCLPAYMLACRQPWNVKVNISDVARPTLSPLAEGNIMSPTLLVFIRWSCPCPCLEGKYGELGVQLHSLLTSALDT